MIRQISASLMCANLVNLKEDIDTLQNNGIDMFHLDVMDGHFVPNLTFGPDILNQIRIISKVPCDYHLMVNNPLLYLRTINFTSNDYVTIHSELDEETIKAVIAYLKKRGCKIGLALNPETEPEHIKQYLDDIDLILVMLIKPGFAGQPIVEGILKKPKKVKQFLKKHCKDNILISVDGGVSIERSEKLSKDGVNIYVGGTSGLFRKDDDLVNSLNKFKTAIIKSK